MHGHLDHEAIEQLEQALDAFDGTMLLVTHERRTLDTVRLTRRWHVDGGRVSEIIADCPAAPRAWLAGCCAAPAQPITQQTTRREGRGRRHSVTAITTPRRFAFPVLCGSLLLIVPLAGARPLRIPIVHEAIGVALFALVAAAAWALSRPASPQADDGRHRLRLAGPHCPTCC